jgi:hypothetical protein
MKDALRPGLLQGMEYYERTYLEGERFASVWPGRKYPKDIACVAEGLLLVTTFYRIVSDNLKLVSKFERLLEFALDHMQDVDGAFVMRLYRWHFRTRLKSLRWCAAPMLHAMASWSVCPAH